MSTLWVHMQGWNLDFLNMRPYSRLHASRGRRNLCIRYINPISAFRASHAVLGKFISHLMEDIKLGFLVHFYIQHTSDEQLWLGDCFMRQFSEKIGTGSANSLAWKGLTRCQEKYINMWEEKEKRSKLYLFHLISIYVSRRTCIHHNYE